MRWVGIDEAGYGPNLGPLVMTAVIAEGREATPGASSRPERPPPDLWSDLATTVDRAGGRRDRLWIDDSKAILHGGKGRDRLETACLALLDAVGPAVPENVPQLLSAVAAGTARDAELERWTEAQGGPILWPSAAIRAAMPTHLGGKPLSPTSGDWRLVAVRSVVLGPQRFNERLGRLQSKARVHFTAFQKLVEHAWELAADGMPTAIEGDKHGGRHYYLEPLSEAFPDTWIDRGPEGPDLSQYTLRGEGRRMTLSLAPRADASNGLVALASIVSKTVREIWMEAFNGFWTSRVPDLKPTAGYPVDAARFRAAIEPLAVEMNLPPDLWWRRK